MKWMFGRKICFCLKGTNEAFFKKKISILRRRPFVLCSKKFQKNPLDFSFWGKQLDFLKFHFFPNIRAAYCDRLTSDLL